MSFKKLLDVLLPFSNKSVNYNRKRNSMFDLCHYEHEKGDHVNPATMRYEHCRVTGCNCEQFNFLREQTNKEMEKYGLERHKSK